MSSSCLNGYQRVMRSLKVSLRLYFLVIMLVAVGTGWIANVYREHSEQRAVAAQVEQMGGYVQWSESPRILSRLVVIALEDANVTNLPELPELESLSINVDQLSLLASSSEELRTTCIAIHGVDAETDLSILAKYSCLRSVILCKSHSSVLPSLKALRHIKALALSEMGVTDLTAVSNLRNVELLHLHNVPVSDLRPLEKLTHLEVIEIQDTSVNDLSPLTKLHSLRELHLVNNPVELTQLSRLGHLRLIELVDRRLTDDEITTLKQKLPDCVEIRQWRRF